MPPRRYHKWSELEDAALRVGVARHGLKNWTAIRNDRDFRDIFHLHQRSPDHLRLKWDYILDTEKNQATRAAKLINAYEILRAAPPPPAVGAAPPPPAVGAVPRPPAVGAVPRPPAVGAAPRPPAVGAAPRPPAVGAAPPPAVGAAPRPPAVGAAHPPPDVGAVPPPPAVGAVPPPPPVGAARRPPPVGAAPPPPAIPMTKVLDYDLDDDIDQETDQGLRLNIGKSLKLKEYFHSAFFYSSPDGVWREYDTEIQEILQQAFKSGLPSVKVEISRARNKLFDLYRMKEFSILKISSEGDRVFVGTKSKAMCWMDKDHKMHFPLDIDMSQFFAVFKGSDQEEVYVHIPKMIRKLRTERGKLDKDMLPMVDEVVYIFDQLYSENKGQFRDNLERIADIGFRTCVGSLF